VEDATVEGETPAPGPASRQAPVTNDAVLGLQRLLQAAEDGRLSLLADRHGLVFLAAHGSAARREPQPRDLDIAFLAVAGTDVVALRHELYQLTGYEHLDLADLRISDVIGRGIILQDAIGLYEREAGSFADYRATAMTRYASDRWLLEAQREAMAR
jgi:hypothetical protein